MKYKDFLFILLSIILSATNSFCQTTTDVHIKLGISNYWLKESADIIGADFNPRPTFAIGATLNYKPKENHWAFPISLDFTRFEVYQSKNSRSVVRVQPDGTNKELNLKDWHDNFYSLQLSLGLDREFEKWWHFYIQAVNTFHILKPESTISKEFEDGGNIFIKDFNPEKSYSFGINIGTDFIIKEKMIFGISYHKDITPSFTIKDGGEKDKGYLYFLSLKLGYKIF